MIERYSRPAMKNVSSIPHALMIASAGAVVAVALTWRWQIGGIENVDLSPSMHWPTPITHDAVTHDRGPVLVTIHYKVRSDKTAEFLNAVRQLGKHRRRDGAFAWSVIEHAEEPNHFIESFSVESWLDHLRQHERVTDADRVLQADVHSLLVAGSKPAVTHYVAPQTPSQEESE